MRVSPTRLGACIVRTVRTATSRAVGLAADASAAEATRRMRASRRARDMRLARDGVRFRFTVDAPGLSSIIASAARGAVLSNGGTPIVRHWNQEHHAAPGGHRAVQARPRL